jgi:two-component system, OmpR family, response regulator
VSNRPRALVVDDEENICFVVAHELRAHNFEVDVAGTAAEALRLITSHQPDVIVLDVMLPDMNGFALLELLRDSGIETPVLFLTARDGTSDRVRGLTGGGADYVVKPFALAELVARVKLRLREGGDATDRRLRCGGLVLDDDTHQVTRDGQVIHLSPTEFRLLRELLIDQGRVLSRAQLLDRVWDFAFDGDPGIVDKYVSYLRRKIDTTDDKLIHTIRGIGFSVKSVS